MVSKELVIIFVITFMLPSCYGLNKKLERDGYIEWVRNEKNGLKKIKVIGDIEILVQYKPMELMALREYNNDGPDKFAKVVGQYKGMQYYDVSIDMVKGNETVLKKGLRSEQEFYDRLYYFSYGAKNDITLIENGVRKECKLYHFERSYDLSKHSTILLGFEEESGHESDSKILEFNATALHLGIVKIEIESSDLKKIPQVKI